MEEDSSYFPADIIGEILSRTSLKTIGRSRLLSRALNSATYESSFSQNLTKRTDTISGFLLQSYAFFKHSSAIITPNNNYGSDYNADGSVVFSLDFLPRKDMRIVAATKQGLLLCMNENAPKRVRIPEFYVCKPTTRQWEQIPNPKTRFFTEATAMVVLRSKPLRFKIVRFSKPKCAIKRFKSEDYSTLNCEVFDSKKWAWRKFKDDVRLPCGEFFVGPMTAPPAACASGVMYWLMTNMQVFAFRADKDEDEDENEDNYWRIFDLPYPLCSKIYYNGRARLVEYCGRLGMVCERDDFFEFWVMEDGEGNVWSKRRRILKSVVGLPFAFWGSDIALVKGCYDFTWYNLESGKARIFYATNLTAGHSNVHGFQSDFETCNFKMAN